MPDERPWCYLCQTRHVPFHPERPNPLAGLVARLARIFRGDRS